MLILKYLSPPSLFSWKFQKSFIHLWRFLDWKERNGIFEVKNNLYLTSEKYLQTALKCSKLQLLATKCFVYFTAFILSIINRKVILTIYRINNLSPHCNLRIEFLFSNHGLSKQPPLHCGCIWTHGI